MSNRERERSELFKRDELNDPEIKAELSIDQLVWRQVDRTNISSMSDEGVFAANVRVLLSLLPRHKREEIEERKDEYVDVNEDYKYRYFAGIPIGTVEKPILGSPALVQEETVDWYSLYELILNAFEETGISWKYVKEMVEISMVEEKKINPTPYFLPPDQKVVRDAGEKKPTHVCFICNWQIMKGQGLLYLGKMVHKGVCFDKAKKYFFEKYKDKVT